MLALVLVACLAPPALAQSSFDTADGYYEDATQRAAEEDVDAAIIQLKNALQLNEAHTPSMLLLGDLILQAGEPAQAAIVLSEALLLGADERAATPLLVEAYLQSSNYNAILNDLPYDEAPATLRAELMAAHAQALIGLGRMNEAAALIERSKVLEPDNFRAQLAAGTLQLRRNQPLEALDTSETLVDTFANDDRAWSARASALQYVGDLDGAIGAYSRALEISPGNVDARLSLIAIYLQREQEELAGREVEYLRENFPQEPRAAYFEAVLAAAAGNEAEEQRALAEAANGIEALAETQVSSNLQLLMMGALSNMGLGAHETANGYLERYVAINPDDPGAQRLLAMNLLALKENKKALRTLVKLNSLFPKDPETRSLLASAYAAEGQHGKAADLLASAIASSEGSSDFEAQLGISLLNAGRLNESISTLERVAAQQPDNAGIRLPLAMAYMRSGRWSDAEAIIVDLRDRDPSDNNLPNLLSINLLSQGRDAEAEVLLQELIARAPEYLPAQINLAKLKRQQQAFDEARTLLDLAEENHPEDARVAFEQAQLALAEGDSETALRVAERAVQLAPRDTSMAAFLTRRYLAEGMLQEAEQLAEKASVSSDDPFAGSLLFGRTLVFLEKPKQAALLYTQMARNVDYAAPQLLQIAEQQSRIGQHDSAILTLSSALSRGGDSRIIRRALMSEHLSAGQPRQTLELAAQYQSEYPQDPIGYLFEGDAALASDEPQQAEKAFRAASIRGAGAPAVLGLYRALRDSGQRDAAEAVLADAVDGEDADLPLMASYSDALLAAGKWAEAEATLSSILAIAPGSWMHWNNRAMVRMRLGGDGAEQDARQAVQLAPESPATNDTLGWILIELGRAGEALPYLRQAAARDSTNPVVRYHLGVALSALGRDREAQKELYFALEEPAGWRERADAEALLARLRGDS